eukprot:COSAG04_NODE_302_length_17393_cov_6.251417_14_plen_140_part_00
MASQPREAAARCEGCASTMPRVPKELDVPLETPIEVPLPSAAPLPASEPVPEPEPAEDPQPAQLALTDGPPDAAPEAQTNRAPCDVEAGAADEEVAMLATSLACPVPGPLIEQGIPLTQQHSLALPCAQRAAFRAVRRQ